MANIQADTIVGFNAYVDGLRDDGISFTHLQFDSSGINKVCVDQPSKEVPKMTDFNPGASTPLIDASYKTIKAVETAVTLKPADKVVITIMTDGFENASTEFTYKDLNLLIKEKMAMGWEFNFLGAGIDAYAQGAQMGFSAAQTMSYDAASPDSTMRAYATRGQTTRLYASGAVNSMNFTSAEKIAAGDKFADKSDASCVAPDGAAVSVLPVPPAAKPAKRTAKPIIEDVVL